MDNPDFEADADLLAIPGTGLAFGNDQDSGELLVNAVEADEFDPRYANDVEGLLFLGYLTSEVEVFGHSFVLKTLTRGERLACALAVKEYEDTLGLADALQSAYLAASIVTVDSRPLSIPLDQDSNTPLHRIRQNFPLVNKYFDPLLEALYAHYGNLLLRQAAAFAELAGKLTASRL